MDQRPTLAEHNPHKCDLRPLTRNAAAARACGSIRHLRGLTLLELMLTVMIVGVLTVLSVATYTSYKAKSDVAQTVTELGIIQTAISIYAVDNQGPPNS